MTEISKTTWYDFPALALESAALRLVIVPELGAKIVSLYDKAHRHEWLVPPMRPLKRAGYGADFVSQDMSGWDEMMPTINACRFEGHELPDHGEVWGIPWTVEDRPGEIAASVTGTALPYRFARSAALAGDGCVKLSYALTNTGGSPFPYLWAAHPQFAADEQTRILLPPEVTRMVNVVDGHPVWGKIGELHPWPQARSAAGEVWQMDRVRPVENHTCRKFYVPPEQPVAWAALRHEGLGCQMRLEWSPAELPYLGLWVDEGTYNTAPVAALEPSNAYYDGLDTAAANGTAPVLAPGTTAHWELRICISH